MVQLKSFDIIEITEINKQKLFDEYKLISKKEKDIITKIDLYLSYKSHQKAVKVHFNLIFK